MVTATPAVSVIMNCYNSAEFLAEAIDSVFAQTFTDWEIIFFDNCSTDESPAIAKRYDGRLKYFRGEKNVPLGHARNLALAKASGKYIAFLDCDDLWCPEKLALQVAHMEQHPEYGMIYCDALFFFEKGRSFRLFPHGNAPEGKVFRSLLRRYALPMPAIMVRRDVLEKVGGHFDERFSMVEDADLFMRVAYYYPVAYVREVLVKRRMHEQSWTAKKKEWFPKEEDMLLAKFAALWPTFNEEYKDEIKAMRAIIAYQYAVLDWEKGNNSIARQRMKPYLNTLKKIAVPYYFSYLPYPVYKNFKYCFKSLTAPLTGSVDYQSF